MKLSLYPQHAELLLAGSFDLTAHEQLGAALDAAVELRDSVHLDLAAVDFVDGGSIRLALRARRTLAARGGQLRISRASMVARRPIQLLGLTGLLGVPEAPTAEEPAP